jgi:protein PsiE
MRQNQYTEHALKVLSFLEYAGLSLITICTVAAGIHEVNAMLVAGSVTLADLLLLFLYLEIFAMVGVYFESGKLPVQFPIFIAIVALARFLVLDLKNLDHWDLLGVSSSVLLLTLAVLVVRYGHVKLPYRDAE